ncbi:MAG: SAM-dependent methyltransferase [Acidimicrobiales bacterium]
MARTPWQATPLGEEVSRRAHRFGSLRFDEVVELALYHPEHGFYAGGSGARSDFLTSPEVGALFGAVLAGALDAWWVELGEPDPYVVVEAGAGSGTLATTVLGAEPACAPALRYVLVERSSVMRQQQARRLPLEPAGLVLGPAVVADVDQGPEVVPGLGPLVTSLAELPAGPFEGVVVANELLDNLAFRLLERGDGGWDEVRVDHELRELAVEAPPDAAREADRLAPEAPPGGRIPLQHQAQAWLRSALGSLVRGRVVVIDYADSMPSLATRPWTEWVRTYRSHGRGGHPLEHLGEQDITCEVAVDPLAHVRPPVADRAQSDFLRAHGIDRLTEAAREHWQERAHVGDLDALTARSRVGEAAALTDPEGLGGFRVLEWDVR